MSLQWWIETRSAEVDYALLGLMKAPLQWWTPYGMRTDRSAPWFIIEVDTNRSWHVYFGMAASKRSDLKGRLIRNSFTAQGTSRDDLYSLLHQYLSPNLSFKESYALALVISGSDEKRGLVKRIARTLVRGSE